MNWLIKLGNWWEENRSLKKSDYRLILKICHEGFKEESSEMQKKYDGLRSLMDKRFDENKIGVSISKEVALINARLDRLELYVGLKRDPQPVTIPDSARIS